MEFKIPDRPTMRSNATIGDRIRFAYSRHGSTLDQIDARKHLAIGTMYTVLEVRPCGDYRADVRLIEIPDVWFNTALFMDAAGA